MPHEIVYPQGCRPVTDDLGADELIRRLKVIFSIKVSQILLKINIGYNYF